MITLSGTIDSHYEGSLTCTSLVKSPTRANTAAQQPGSVKTEVELPLISVDYQIVGQWAQTWPERREGVGHQLQPHPAANEQRVVGWEISFDVPRHGPASTRNRPSGTR